MTVFSYKAKKGPGKVVHGTIEADTTEVAIRKIAELGLTPLDVKMSGKRVEKSVLLSTEVMASFRVPKSEMVTFTRQISDFVDAGVPVLRALTVIKKRVRHSGFKAIVEKLCGVVSDGGMLSDALALFPRCFSPFYINIVRAGEISGNLDGALIQLADFLEKDYEARAQVKSSLIYPSLILIVGAVTIFVLFAWVIPRITVIFDDMGQALPLITKVLLGVSDFLAQFWWLVLLGCACVGIYLQRLYLTENGREWVDGLKLRMPLLGGFVRDVEVGRFARTLATLLENGVVIVAALESVRKVIGNVVLKVEVAKMVADVTAGASLVGAIKESALFSEADSAMIAVGEETGKLYTGLHKLASYHEAQAQRFMKMMTSMIEPALILGLGCVVGFVVIGMLMPIFRMNMMIQ
ncbi:type II secretion system F family protein [Candidatus Omnitrophota bacterium]